MNAYDETYFFDVESFPTFTCVTFLEDSSGEFFQFSIGCGRNQLDELTRFVDRNILLVGFNNISYDDPVIRFLQNWNGRGDLPHTVFELSGRLVLDACRRDEDILALRYPRDVYFSWDYLDLLKIMAFDRMGVSLKQVAVNLLHEKIQDLPYPYNYRISTEEEVETVLEYNKNDVLITKKLYYHIQPQIKLREEIGKLYGVDVRNASDSKMGNIILEHFYKTELGIDPRSLRELRTKRDKVNLGNCIPAVISFTTKELLELKRRISNTTVYSYNKFKFETFVEFGGLGYSIGSGGIHSTEKACRFDSTETEKIISCDIGSMYPSCIIINNIYPKHLGKDFVRVLSTLTAERLAAKKTNKVKADALKITINGLYGKLNSDTFWLEDAEAMLRVTISGQLYILMLIEMLADKGIRCISANTDGIECIVPVEKEELYYEVCKQWEEKTKFVLEYTEYASYIKRDVNNYIAITTNGKVKTKGAFIPEVDIKKGYKHPIVPRAVNEYFIHGIPVDETIRNCRSILDFAISHKPGREFQMEYHTLDGVNKLQRTNRFYISRGGGTIQKKKGTKRTGLFVKQNIRLLNDYDPSVPFEDYDLNVEWYIREARKMVEEIEPKNYQIDMFATVGIDWGKRVPLVKQSMITADLSVNDREKVSPEDVRTAYRTRDTFDVSAKYMLVTNVNTKYAPALDLYSLKNGTSGHKLKVRKSIFEEYPLKTGDVILILETKKEPQKIKEGDYFVDVPDKFVWWLTKYNLVNDFSKFRRRVND